MGLLHDAGLADFYQHDIHDLNTLLDAMSRRGMPIDEQARLELVAELQAELDATMAHIQALVPDECKPKKVYKRKPTVVLPFVLSHKGLLAYCVHKGYAVPLKPKRAVGGSRPTLDDAALVKIALAHPRDTVLPLVLRHSELCDHLGWLRWRG